MKVKLALEIQNQFKYSSFYLKKNYNNKKKSVMSHRSKNAETLHKTLLIFPATE